MTKKRLNQGFTIVEIAVVIFIIAFLATMTMLVFNNVQKQTRDTKRANDMKLFMGSLNTYYNNTGEYPFSCNFGLGSTCTATTSLYASSVGSAPISTISKDTTISALQTLLPGVGSAFGSPTSTSMNPINVMMASNNFISKDSYFLLSTDLYGLTSTVGLATNSDGTSGITCNFNAQGNTQPHNYVTGYFSEVQGKWVFYQGSTTKDIADVHWNSTSKPECVPSTS